MTSYLLCAKGCNLRFLHHKIELTTTHREGVVTAGGKNTYRALGIEPESWGAVNKLIAIVLSSASGWSNIVSKFGSLCA